jgi:acetate kinase
MNIIIGNIGTTSLKTKIISIKNNNEIETLGEANLDKIKDTGESNFTHSIGKGSTIKDMVDITGYESGIKFLLDFYIKNEVIQKLQDIEAVGFKCILGEKNGANLLNKEMIAELERFQFVAPSHNIPYIEAIGHFKKILGDIPMVSIFEPSFHYSIPEHRRILGSPWEWYEKLGIRKHGFHGASHRYLSAMAFKLYKTEKINLITVHLGGSSSISAVKNGMSVDTSFNFSPNSGLLQGTRVGDMDGTALLFAMKELDLTIEDAQKEISENSGLKETAGIGTEDMRAILDAADNGNNRAKLAVDNYIYGIRKYIGSFSAVLEGIDCIVFGGGIGEKGIQIRQKCLEGMEYLGLKLDPDRNNDMNGRQGLISSDDSNVRAYIVPTNEELVVAYFTKKVVEKRRDLNPEEMIFRLTPDS